MKTLAEYLAEKGLGSDDIWTAGRRAQSDQPPDHQDAIDTTRAAIERHGKMCAITAEREAQELEAAARERAAAARERKAEAAEREAADNAPTRREARHHDEAAERHAAAAAEYEAAAERFEREAARAARGRPTAAQRAERRRLLESAAAERVAADREDAAASRKIGIANRLHMEATGAPGGSVGHTGSRGTRRRRHHHPHPRPRHVHRSPRSAEAISATRDASISPSRRTVTSRASITTDPIGPGPVALSTSNVANPDRGRGSTPTASADDATASLPWRARLRHVDNCQRDIP